jgi:Outer membrane protein beta-barrel domain
LNLTARTVRTAILLLAVVLCGSSREARADYLFMPFIGGAFGGNTAFLNLEQGAGSTQLIFGGSTAWLSPGVIGFEGDFAYAPRFFERDNLAGRIVSSKLVTLSGSVIVTVPQRLTGYSLRPYLVGGVGLIHSDIDYDGVFPSVDDNSLGVNLGGGAIGFLTPRTGVRFELRNFRTPEREANPANLDVSARVSFWRFTVGVVIRR